MLLLIKLMVLMVVELLMSLGLEPLGLVLLVVEDND